MNKTKNKFLKIFLKLILSLIFIFTIFYDIALSNINFPFLTTVIFILFILIRFIRPIFR